jgi:hypothetical protein
MLAAVQSPNDAICETYAILGITIRNVARDPAINSSYILRATNIVP